MFLASWRFSARRRGTLILLLILGLNLFVIHLRKNPNARLDLGFLDNTINLGDAGQVKSSTVGIFVASQTHDNVSWIRNAFPDWQKYIYVADDPYAPLSVPVNKGREAVTYLR